MSPLKVILVFIVTFVATASTASSECRKHSDCPEHLACQLRICTDPCRLPRICGKNADCKVKNHVPVCFCPRGLFGDAFKECVPQSARDICEGVCGINAKCEVRDGDVAVCSCPPYHTGDPFKHCVELSDDDLCRGVCGINANCDIRNKVAICSCPKNHYGDPFKQCVQHTKESLCNACGVNADCEVINWIPVCNCPIGTTGDPFKRCSSI